MADYKQSTGITGTMMIRDTGTFVELWITSGNTTTWTSDLGYSWTANGTGSSAYYYNAGSGWVRLKSFQILTDQTVRFSIEDTNTSGFGGPTTMSVFINRSSAPAAPSAPRYTGLLSSGTGVTVSFSDGSNNGQAITARQRSYGKTSSASTTIISSSGSTAVTGLSRSTTYYFKARTYNSKGWSPWSGITSIRMGGYVPAPTAPAFTNVRQTSVESRFISNGTGDPPVYQWQTGYGTDPDAPQLFEETHALTATNLTPGATYYFWGRGRNAVGWGPWSTRSSVTLRAGAWVDVNGVKKRAIPYVRVNGVWTPAESWVKIAGMWKPTG